MNNAFAKTLIFPGQEFLHAWKSKSSKNQTHLRFNSGAEINYMLDGILTLTDGTSGLYDRVSEWSGEDGDDHEVILHIDAQIYHVNGAVLRA